LHFKIALQFKVFQVMYIFPNNRNIFIKKQE
jgi:hypothetical protein